MYDLTLNIETEQTTLTFIPPGIQENLRLAKPDNTYPIVYDKSKNNSEFIAFYFMNPEGQTFVHTEFVPSSDKPEAVEKKTANLVKRIMHIGKKLVDESKLKFKATTFEELARKYIAAIGNDYVGKTFRGKIVYNNKNYTTFPNYVPFIESMSIPLDKSKLKMSPDDKVVKSKADNIIPSTPNPFTTEPSTSVDAPVASSPNINDLPF